MRPFRDAMGALGCLVAALALSACTVAAPNPSGSASRTPVPSASPVAAIDCFTEPSVRLSAPTPDPGPHPMPGRVPDGFDAVAAWLCSIPAGADAGRVTITRYEGDLDPLLAALALPDADPRTDIACNDMLELVAALWLESSSGEFIPVHWPRDACWKTLPAAHREIEALTPTETVVVTE